jgi:ABC-2 type transport system permease protein
MNLPLPIQRTRSVAKKEVLHMLRDRTTMFFALFIPIVELFMLGFAINTNVRHVRTVILDQARTQESRTLLHRFENSEDFSIVEQVQSDKELSEAIVAGRAQVGIKIPENYSRNIQSGKNADFLIIVDGSQSSIAAEAVNVGNAIALRESLSLMAGDRPASTVEAHPQVLYNPDTRSPNFFIPGLLVVMCQIMAIMLTATSIVREKENGTIEQLFMTPVRAGELMIGKVAPYLVMTIIEFCTITFLMWSVFQVPINGSFWTLLGIGFPFILAMLGLGLLISTRASTRDAAMQMTMGTLLPAIFLSGYVFPIDSMPRFFWYVSQAIPTTWLIDASRGVILRGAGWAELWVHAAVLWSMAIAMMVLSTLRFHKQLT